MACQHESAQSKPSPCCQTSVQAGRASPPDRPKPTYWHRTPGAHVDRVGAFSGRLPNACLPAASDRAHGGWLGQFPGQARDRAAMWCSSPPGETCVGWLLMTVDITSFACHIFYPMKYAHVPNLSLWGAWSTHSYFWQKNLRLFRFVHFMIFTMKFSY